MTAWVLVIWFGIFQTQTTVSVSDIFSQQECQRLGAAMKRSYGGDIQCFPYTKAK